MNKFAFYKTATTTISTFTRMPDGVVYSTHSCSSYNWGFVTGVLATLGVLFIYRETDNNWYVIKSKCRNAWQRLGAAFNQ
ncbi:hypothetical protein EB796_016610 [Bugula neritina]|uniref:Uncharacterized protein n=1 Tax=Bugula neritina TaxID=10212 RepID=A0A7J7JH05_BUGNE|nr:hypothetical protein EB796_016610 [Bugula neritina]